MTVLAPAGAPVAPGVLYARGLTGRSPGLVIRHADGRTVPVPLDGWLGAASGADLHVLDRAVGPVLDVGCGPGRHVAALGRRAVTALGIDVSPEAVRATRARGGAAAVACVFSSVPAAGRWRTALLLDGNVGIGGDPVALLRRCGELVARDGTVLVEVDAPGSGTRRAVVRLEDGPLVSRWFAWSSVAADDVAGIAADAGLRLTALHHEEDRWFADLARA
ncbi:methyltransferase domain-containing protein [Conexibacter sp. W3-3-2]|uniref:methyltransferase domain-containing protein n=1 Tax=Conexibacter sp. W3-3-2 TaxID=2675227 RepID=UPI00281687D3|nr:methyltransferase domain-containing protein [Conexibacter sp. W3-3-2]